MNLSFYESTPLLSDVLYIAEDKLRTVENHFLFYCMDEAARFDFYTLMGVTTLITDPEIQETPDKSGVVIMACELIFEMLDKEYSHHPNKFSQDPLICYVPMLTQTLSGHVEDKAIIRHNCKTIMDKVKTLPCVNPLIPGASDLIASCEEALEKLINCIGGSNG